MPYLPLFLLFAAVLIAAWFYVQRAKRRDVTTAASVESSAADPDPATPERPA